MRQCAQLVLKPQPDLVPVQLLREGFVGQHMRFPHVQQLLQVRGECICILKGGIV